MDPDLHAPNATLLPLLWIRWFHALGHQRGEVNFLPWPRCQHTSLKFQADFWRFLSCCKCRSRDEAHFAPTCQSSHTVLSHVGQQGRAGIEMHFLISPTPTFQPHYSGEPWCLFISSSQRDPYNSCSSMQKERETSVDWESWQTLFKLKRGTADGLLDY